MVNNTTLPRSNTGLGNCYLIMLNDPDVVNSLKHIFGEKKGFGQNFPREQQNWDHHKEELVSNKHLNRENITKRLQMRVERCV